MQRKKMLIAVLTIALLIGTASAALVTYLSNTIWTQTTVESPVFIKDNWWTFSSEYGGDNHLMLVEITNLANSNITGNVELHVYKYDGANWQNFDGAGIYVALSDDIGFAIHDSTWYKHGGSECNSGYLDWKDWLAANPDWFDWTLSIDDRAKFDTWKISNAPIVGRDGVMGSSFNVGDFDGDMDSRLASRINSAWLYVPFIDGKMTIPMFSKAPFASGTAFPYAYDQLEPGENVYLVFWTFFDPALEPGTYAFQLRVTP